MLLDYNALHKGRLQPHTNCFVKFKKMFPNLLLLLIMKLMCHDVTASVDDGTKINIFIVSQNFLINKKYKSKDYV